jgi:acetyl-CoA acetyltransferase
MPSKVYVIGVGMTKFEKPGARDWDYPDMAKEAGTNALEDAGIPYDEVDQAVVGYVYGESTSGQRAVYQLGLTGIPVYNVNNNCSTGSTALFLGRQLIAGGISECVLALGFEKMEKGSLGVKYTDRVNPMDKHVEAMVKLRGFETSPVAPQIFGNAAREHMERYGSTPEQFAKIGLKNHRHSVNNPYSQFQDEYTLEEILSAKMVHAPLTRLQCCPTSDGAGAVVLASEEFVHKHSLEDQAVEILGQSMVTDTPETFEQKSSIKLIGSEMTRRAANEVYEQTGLGPEDIDVIELHDCFSANEMITYEALGLAKEGEGGKLIDEGAVTYGGDWVVNPSGGLISKGHPLGATGLAQCSELSWQLRGTADARQVPGAKVALQHNIGLGGAVVVTMYRKGFAA